jgi:hypothetical protein
MKIATILENFSPGNKRWNIVKKRKPTDEEELVFGPYLSLLIEAFELKEFVQPLFDKFQTVENVLTYALTEDEALGNKAFMTGPNAVTLALSMSSIDVHTRFHVQAFIHEKVGVTYFDKELTLSNWVQLLNLLTVMGLSDETYNSPQIADKIVEQFYQVYLVKSEDKTPEVSLESPEEAIYSQNLKPETKETIMTTNTTHSFYNIFAATAVSLPFNPRWSNGTGYFDHAVAGFLAPCLAPGQTMKTETTDNRKMIIIGTEFGNCVFFERYTGGANGVIVQNSPDKFKNHLSGSISSEVMEEFSRTGFTSWATHEEKPTEETKPNEATTEKKPEEAPTGTATTNETIEVSVAEVPNVSIETPWYKSKLVIGAAVVAVATGGYFAFKHYSNKVEGMVE